jgi:phage terminase large subunit-like protein
MSYEVKLNTNVNQDWFNAETAADILPDFTPTEDSELFIKLAGNLMLSQGKEAGRTLSEVILPWQTKFLRGFWNHKESFLMLSKGGGKSVLASAIAIAYTKYSHIRGINHRAMVAIMASSVPTAGIIFGHILEAVIGDPEIKSEFKTNLQSRTLKHIPSGIEIVVLSPSLDQAVGRRPCLIIWDEGHELAKIRDADKICSQLRMGARNFGRDARILTISTMSIDAPVGEFKRLLSLGRAVRDGTLVDSQFFPAIFEFPVVERPDLSPLDRGQWFRGAPSLRTDKQPGTMDAEELDDEIKAAANTEDRLQLSLILSQRLGIQSNLRQDEAESILHGYWGRAPKCGPDVPRDGITAIGVDVGGVDDPFALGFVTRRPDGVHEIRVKQYLTRNGYDRAGGKNQPVYDEAIEQKTLEIHETVGGIELAVFAECKRMMGSLSNSIVIGGDEHGGVAGFSTRFSQEVCEFKSVPQRDYIMGSALTALESMLADGRLEHQHCPLLNENVQNLSITESDGNGRKLRKKDAGLSGQGYAKIDGIVAAIIGVKLVGEENSFDAAAMMG